MFDYRSPAPTVRLITKHLVVRLLEKKDALALVTYCNENKEFLQPWEPARDKSYYTLSNWRARLGLICEHHIYGSAFHFGLFGHDEHEVLGVANYSNIIRGAFHSCYLGYSLGEKSQGKGLMFEALESSLDYVFDHQKMHRIMANYMPNNQRSGNLLARLGFVQEGFAKDYLRINGQWRDHVLTARIHPQWCD